MDDKQIVITQYDLDRLRALIRDLGGSDSRESLGALSGELDRALVVLPTDVPPDVVTMNSRVSLVDMDTSEKMEISLVFPDDANPDAGAISVLAPIGTAIIGYRQGGTVEWPVPSGLRRFRIDRVVYQPEASGDMEL
jgi:regulator of nucleoside diphosphate kinase